MKNSYLGKEYGEEPSRHQTWRGMNLWAREELDTMKTMEDGGSQSTADVSKGWVQKEGLRADLQGLVATL